MKQQEGGAGVAIRNGQAQDGVERQRLKHRGKLLHSHAEIGEQTVRGIGVVPWCMAKVAEE